MLIGPLNIGVSTVTPPCRHHSQMTSHTTDFLLKHAVPEPGLEFTASRAGGRNTSSVLSTSDNDVWLEGGNDCAVKRGFGGERLEDGEVFGVVYLERGSAANTTVPRMTYSCCLVLARGDKVGSIRGELEIRDLQKRQHEPKFVGLTLTVPE